MTLINRLLSVLTDVVLSLDGTVITYMGDCIFALWNAPVDCDNHEERAVICAAMMLVALEKLNKEIEAEGLPSLGIGIGINTGPAVIGNTGGHNRFMYSPLGDSVNVAARYESSSRKYEQDVLIGETTAQAVPDMVEYLDSIEVKGKSEKLEVFSLTHKAISSARLADYWVSEIKS